MPPRSKSPETRPKKRRKTVDFDDGHEETIPVSDEKETRPESMMETESAEVRFE
jgi:hypothetical protein